MRITRRAYIVTGFAFVIHWFVVLLGTLMQVSNTPYYIHLTHTPLDHFFQWDAQWYAAIAKYGYNIPLSAQHAFIVTGNKVPFAPLQATAYFPFLPLVIHIFGIVGAFIIGNLAFYASLVVMYVLFREKLSDNKAFLAILLFATSFSTVYQTALYTTVYTTLFSALAIYGLRRGDKLGDALASVAGFLATFNHQMGILLGVLALRYLRQRRFGMMFIYAGSVLAGWGVFMVYLWVKFKQPLAMFHAEKSWGRGWAFPGYNWVSSLHVHVTLDTFFVPILVILILLHIFHASRTDNNLLRPDEGSLLVSQEVALWLFFILILSLSTIIPKTPLTSVTRLLDSAWPMYGFLWLKNDRRSSLWMFALLMLFFIFGAFGAEFYTHGMMYE